MSQPTDTLPLGTSQQQIWLDQQSCPGSAHFNIGGIGHVDGPMDIPLYEKALQHLVDESEALRLLPRSEQQQQLVDRWPDKLLEFHDLAGTARVHKKLSRLRRNAFAKPFELDGKQRPWQMIVARYEDNRYWIMARFHHLVMDGYSVALAFRRLSVIYNTLAEGKPVEAAHSVEYHDFIADSTAYLDSPALQKDATFWQQWIEHLPVPLFDAKSKDSEGELGQAPSSLLPD